MATSTKTQQAKAEPTQAKSKAAKPKDNKVQWTAKDAERLRAERKRRGLSQLFHQWQERSRWSELSRPLADRMHW